MNEVKIIAELSHNIKVFKSLLDDLPQEIFLWKQNPEKWCLLEIVCHLYDEEREDFRARVRNILDNPEMPLNSIDPVGWVTERNYIQRNYEEVLIKFLQERKLSIDWLNGLINPKWDNIHNHPKFGELSAKMILANWLAHDYLHFRQIIKLKYDYLHAVSGENLSYAGDW